MSRPRRRLALPAPLATRVADELVTRDLVRALRGPRRPPPRAAAPHRSRGARRSTPSTARPSSSSPPCCERMTEAETEALLVGLHAFLRVLHAPAADGTPPAVPAHDHDFPTERNAMSHAHPETSSIVIHRSGFYDIVCRARSSAPRDAADPRPRRRRSRRPRPRRRDRPGLPGPGRVAARRPGGRRRRHRRLAGDDRPRPHAGGARGARAEYLVASAESLPFEDGSFDVAVSRLVLHHLPGDLKLRPSPRCRAC